jgi:hypothetical protein
MFDIFVGILLLVLYILLLGLLGGLAAKCIAIMMDDGYRTCQKCKGRGCVPDLEINSTCDQCGGFGKIYIPTHQKMG